MFFSPSRAMEMREKCEGKRVTQGLGIFDASFQSGNHGDLTISEQSKLSQRIRASDHASAGMARFREMLTAGICRFDACNGGAGLRYNAGYGRDRQGLGLHSRAIKYPAQWLVTGSRAAGYMYCQ